MKFVKWIILIAGIFHASNLKAEDTSLSLDNVALNNNSIAIYGTACEKIKTGDVKSTVRARVTDKASFIAVGDIADLSDFKKNMSEHDFNVMAYNIVDNMIEDMTVRTLKQNEKEICVEITGFILNQNIYESISHFIDNREQPSSSVEIVKAQHIESDNIQLASASIIPTKTVKSFVYVAPLEFYNNTRSSQHAQIIRDLFNNSDIVGITFEPNKADYIVRAKVLRAKVEPVNDDNNRLQMVVSVEMEGTRDKNRLTENQNRFVLFSKAENEHTVAANLMKKLLDQAGGTIVKRIERDVNKKQKANSNHVMDPVITPVGKSV